MQRESLSERVDSPPRRESRPSLAFRPKTCNSHNASMRRTLGRPWSAFAGASAGQSQQHASSSLVYPNNAIQAQNKLLSQVVGGEDSLSRRWTAPPRHAGVNALLADPGTSESDRNPIVVLHGYGSGLGMFFPNITALQESKRKVFLVDWLGLGASDRPSGFPMRSESRRRGAKCWISSKLKSSTSEDSQASMLKQDPSLASVDAATDFFLDGLLEWFERSGLTQTGSVTLVGHSLGGYLATRFALMYPDLVSRLVLVSPAGLPDPPVPLHGAPPQRHRFSSTRRGALAGSLIDCLWSSNFTPQTLVRFMGDTRGRETVRRAVIGRMGHSLPDGLAPLVGDYLWEITRAPPSGEYALNALLSPPVGVGGVYARVPLEGLLNEAAEASRLSRSIRRYPFKLDVLFGDSDWLGTPVAVRAARRLADSVEIVPTAGHHIYADNPFAFNSAVLKSV